MAPQVTMGVLEQQPSADEQHVDPRVLHQRHSAIVGAVG